MYICEQRKCCALVWWATIAFWDCSGPGCWAAVVVSWFGGLVLQVGQVPQVPQVPQVGCGFVESAAGLATGSEASMAAQRSSFQSPWWSIILSDLE